MKTTFCFSLLMGFVISGLWSCHKEPKYHTDADINIPDPTITTLNDGRKKLDFVIDITQIGNYFYEDFEFKLSQGFTNLVLIDSFQTRLPTAREFVHHSVVVDGPGNYWVETELGANGGSFGVARGVIVPE